ncbi:MAG: peptidylprolyl isomerase [Gammaproteobacteria bacterium]|nr:peptidylprolyl isomerase [Gammaproteobacteria bacterium]
MKIFIVSMFLLCSLHLNAANPQVNLKTNYGTITLELFQDKAPVTVKNFLRYVEQGRYDGTVFHRVKKEFVIQGGGFDKTYEPIDVFSTIKNEATNGLSNTRGTIAMARYDPKDSADSQFFINLTDNDNLDHRNETNVGFGYAVFGKVIKGMDVADEIAKIPTGSIDHVGDSVPAYPVILQDAEVTKTLQK